MAKTARRSAKKMAKKMAGSDGTTRAVISATLFSKLIKDIKAQEADKNEAVGSIGGLISSAVEKHHVNKKALSWYRAAERMSGPKLRDVLEQFDHYREIGGLNARSQNQDEMFDSEERGTTPAPKAPRSGSFAAKLQEAQAAERPITRTIRPRRTQPPTAEEIAEVADRAERANGQPELH